MTAKSISIKGAKRKFGGCAWKAEKLTSGDLSSLFRIRDREDRKVL